MTKNGYLLLTIIFLVLIRIPALVSWNKYMTGNDAAIYMEKGIHLAEGKGFTSSICRYMADRDELREYVNKFGKTTQEIKVAPLNIFLISGLYKVVGESNYMLSINITNLMLFIATLLVIFYCIVPLFSDRYKIGLMTILLVGLNYVFFEGMFGAHLETLSLFLFVAAYAYHSSIIDKDKTKWWEILLYSILLSLLFLSKYSSIPFAGAFVLHHLVRKKYKRFLSVSFCVLILAGSWFILRDILLQGRVIANFTLSPFVQIAPEFLSVGYLKQFMFRMIGVAKRFVTILFDINGLAWLLPFSVVYFAGHRNNAVKQSNWILLIVSLSFFTFYGYIDLRFIYPIFIPLISASLVILLQLIERYNVFARKAGIISLMGIVLSFQLYNMAFFTHYVRKQAMDREAIFTSSDELLQRSGVTKDDCVLTNILGYNVYTDVGIVITPGGLTAENKRELIDLYQIDYVLYCEDQLNTPLAWDQYGVTKDIFTDLPLIAISVTDSRVRLYSTDTNNF